MYGSCVLVKITSFLLEHVVGASKADILCCVNFEFAFVLLDLISNFDCMYSLTLRKSLILAFQ